MIHHLLALSGESLPPVTSRDSSTQGLWGRGDHSVAFVPGSTFAIFDLAAFFWILTLCHNIQSDPSEAHSSDHRRGEWTFAWDRPLETSYYYNIKRSLWQISSKSEEDEPSPDKWAKEECYRHKTCSRFHLGWPRSSTSSWFTTIMILIKQSYDCDLNPSVLVPVMHQCCHHQHITKLTKI